MSLQELSRSNLDKLLLLFAPQTFPLICQLVQLFFGHDGARQGSHTCDSLIFITYHPTNEPLYSTDKELRCAEHASLSLDFKVMYWKIIAFGVSAAFANHRNTSTAVMDFLLKQLTTILILYYTRTRNQARRLFTWKIQSCAQTANERLSATRCWLIRDTVEQNFSQIIVVLQIQMWMLVICPEDLLFIVCLPVDVDEGLAVHAVDVEDAIQVVHLVLEDASWPATGLPRDSFSLLIQTCRGKRKIYSLNSHSVSKWGLAQKSKGTVNKKNAPDTSTDRKRGTLAEKPVMLSQASWKSTVCPSRILSWGLTKTLRGWTERPRAFLDSGELSSNILSVYSRTRMRSGTPIWGALSPTESTFRITFTIVLMTCWISGPVMAAGSTADACERSTGSPTWHTWQ